MVHICFIFLRFWGKFGQSEIESKTEYVTTPSQFFKLLTDPKAEVKDIHFLSDHLVQMEWEEDEELSTPSCFKNIFIAAMTTAHARIKLYSLLDKLQERVLYCDTDSVVYTSKEGETELPLGDYLGELTNELAHDDYIIEWVSSGPKAYSFVTQNGHCSTKLKGFTLNYRNSKKINFQSMKSLVLCNTNTIKTVNPQTIRRNKNTSTIYNVNEEKMYKFTFDKRVLCNDFSSVPYGF